MIKMLVMDVDGTLTDGKIYMSSEGENYKAFNIKDGYAIKNMLYQNDNKGIIPVIITGRNSDIVKRRCEELDILEIYQGIDNKLLALEEIRKKYGFKYNNIAYIGDDDNDLECMEHILAEGGVVGCPKDASDSVIKVASYIAGKNGGEGSVREFIEWIIGKNKI